MTATTSCNRQDRDHKDMTDLTYAIVNALVWDESAKAWTLTIPPARGSLSSDGNGTACLGPSARRVQIWMALQDMLQRVRDKEESEC